MVIQSQFILKFLRWQSGIFVATTHNAMMSFTQLPNLASHHCMLQSLQSPFMASNAVHVIAIDMDKVINIQLHVMSRISAVQAKVCMIFFNN